MCTRYLCYVGMVGGTWLVQLNLRDIVHSECNTNLCFLLCHGAVIDCDSLVHLDDLVEQPPHMLARMADSSVLLGQVSCKEGQAAANGWQELRLCTAFLRAAIGEWQLRTPCWFPSPLGGP